MSKKLGIPTHSTGFWIPDVDLKLVGKDYVYTKKRILLPSKYCFKYVGVEKAIDVIPANTKVRISLAKWWHPDDIVIEDRCYLQLSGWYL